MVKRSHLLLKVVSDDLLKKLDRFTFLMLLMAGDMAANPELATQIWTFLNDKKNNSK